MSSFDREFIRTHKNPLSMADMQHAFGRSASTIARMEREGKIPPGVRGLCGGRCWDPKLLLEHIDKLFRDAARSTSKA